MALKFIRRVSSGFSGGLLPVLPVSRQKRPGGLSGGAGNGCYGKSDSLAGTKKAPQGFFVPY